jgi:hypothetical protein
VVALWTPFEQAGSLLLQASQWSREKRSATLKFSGVVEMAKGIDNPSVPEPKIERKYFVILNYCSVNFIAAPIAGRRRI